MALLGGRFAGISEPSPRELLPLARACQAKPMLSTDFILLRRLRLKIDVIPGPPHNDKVLYSKAIQVIARYPAQEVAQSFSKIPNVEVVTDGGRDPRSWQWL